MLGLKPCFVAGYLADLYKTAGNGDRVSPGELTGAICSICECKFLKVGGEWVVQRRSTIVSLMRAEFQIKESELTAGEKYKFSKIADYVKWDLIHQKLKALNEAEAA